MEERRFRVADVGPRREEERHGRADAEHEDESSGNPDAPPASALSQPTNAKRHLVPRGSPAVWPQQAVIQQLFAVEP
jgi:hypothetical protein